MDPRSFPPAVQDNLALRANFSVPKPFITQQNLVRIPSALPISEHTFIHGSAQTWISEIYDMLGSTSNTSMPKGAIVYSGETERENELCEWLEKRIIMQAEAVYDLRHPPAIIIGNLPDGTPVAQLLIESPFKLVMLEARGLPPSKTGVKGRPLAMENLLNQLENAWGQVIDANRGSMEGGPYYITKNAHAGQLADRIATALQARAHQASVKRE
ncbi:hypothetical protein CC78DRAFT_577014 [Lojkania enalia]|uniref:Uncharacterized protein n=1 Tax=Lojkania enalia TaxID=147567 RepID=A0A9P4KH61_9PLEO|nr:hypothetical protein CC78DRAFT_577014 [Didymosphaeria enalia]